MLKDIFRALLPKPVLNWIRWHRLMWPVPCFSKRDLDRVFRDIVNGLDISHLQILQAKAQSIVKKDSACAAKYFFYDYWLRESIRQAALLGLHQKKGLRIIDIGCGPGFFLKTCDYFGHSATGLDLPFSFMTSIQQWVYEELPSVLKCKDRIMRYHIAPFTNIPIEGVFDLITCFLVSFNNHKRTNTWRAKEWAFFLEDMQKHLSKGGRLYFALNKETDIFSDFKYYDQDIYNLFISKKAYVNKNEVLIVNP